MTSANRRLTNFLSRWTVSDPTRESSSWRRRTVQIFSTMLSCVRDVSTDVFSSCVQTFWDARKFYTVHAKDKPLAKDVDLAEVAKMTPRFYGGRSCELAE